jgi:hypothetical protein
MPIMFPGQMKGMIKIVRGIKEDTGFDALNIKSYANLMHGQQPVGAPAPQPSLQSEKQITNYIGKPTDLHDAVDAAQKRAGEVIQLGPEQSMQYIQSETERLNKMARDLDKQTSH